MNEILTHCLAAYGSAIPDGFNEDRLATDVSSMAHVPSLDPYGIILIGSCLLVLACFRIWKKH